MAERRMFARCITESDAFLDMPLSTQCLYFHLGMCADDDGFIASPKRVSRMLGASSDDLSLLLAKRFLLAFEDGVVVIKHWKMSNYIKSDRYKPTVYKEHRQALYLKENKAYTLDPEQAFLPSVSTPVPDCIHDCIQNGSTSDTQDSIGKDSIGKDRVSINKKRGTKGATRSIFIKPTVEQIRDYEHEKGYADEAEKFCDYYESCGWTVGKNKPMKDWKAARRTWETRTKESEKPRVQYQTNVDFSWGGYAE